MITLSGIINEKTEELKIMMIKCNKHKTEERLLTLEQYTTTAILDDEFVCSQYSECRSSHTGIFYEGQLHHVGKRYDLLLDSLPFRVVVVGQEYGHKPSRVSYQTRYNMIMSRGLNYRFKATDGYKARNPHMRGTTNVLRLLFGLPLSTDHDSEFLMINGEQVHLFDCFALVNYLICSAISTSGKKQGKATATMKRNCHGHFREVLRILEPSVIVVQGKSYWEWIKKAFDSIKQKEEQVYSATLGFREMFVGVFTHP